MVLRFVTFALLKILQFRPACCWQYHPSMLDVPVGLEMWDPHASHNPTDGDFSHVHTYYTYVHIFHTSENEKIPVRMEMEMNKNGILKFSSYVELHECCPGSSPSLGTGTSWSCESQVRGCWDQVVNLAPEACDDWRPRATPLWFIVAISTRVRVSNPTITTLFIAKT